MFCKLSNSSNFIIIYLLMFLFNGCSSDVISQDDDGMSGTIQFGGPQDMNDEMMNSPFVPDELQCDACIAVSYKLWEGLNEYNKKHPSLKNELSESTLIDLMDEVCSDQEVWKQYGMKKIKKVTRLSGPGMETEEVPGVTASGGKWPARLQDLCETMIGDHGEVTLYNVYKLAPTKKHFLKNFLCYGTKSRDKCSKLEERKFNEHQHSKEDL
ncbi:hypothetical protein HELRODRAFT_193031 [Helobdella robusta]|uniref:DUF3456 domain-containing protein n=1 Tax=Helobdella robusta TaxID=6412 RepID=T1FUJ6_HELRO|nr:hypothetical protein HELRODRAFT_193031 [Helobdella robusta]ESN98288.1 hypothetical protein HELRODRAFT_193031 [Helobdella robusta]